MQVGAVHLVPRGGVYRQIFEDEVLLVRSLDAARSKAGFPTQREKLSLLKVSDISTDARLLLGSQQKWVEKTPCNDPTETLLPNREATFQKVWKNAEEKAAEEVGSLPDVVAPEETGSNILELLSEGRRGRHVEALTSMRQELVSIAKDMEPFVLEPGKSLLAKLMESDRKIELLVKKIESDTALEGLSMEGLEELWNIIHQESFTRKKWIREMDESLQKAEWCRADKITDVLRKYTVKLEEISFFLSADVYRLMNNEAMMINRALLANQRAVAQLFSNLMKSELQWELSHRFNWQDKVKDWKLLQKNRVVHSFREFMASEDIQNPPAVKTEMDNMITDQFLLSGRRMEFLQHLGDLLPPGHTKAEINECYHSLVNLNRSIDSCHVQRMTKIHIQCGMTQQKCLAEVELCQNNLVNLSVCTKNEAEEIVNSELLPLTEKLKSRFEEELEQMGRDFEELAKKNEGNCTALYSYLQEAMDLWDVHQTKLSQQEGEFQKTLKGCRWKQLKSIQKMEDQLDVILAQLRTASSEEKLKKCFENSLSTLDAIRAGYETLHQVLMDQVAAYPEDTLQKLISYSKSISQYFNVKEIFTQNLQGEIEFTFQDQAEGLEQQAESILQENKGEEKMKSSKQAKGETNTKKNEAEIAQGTKETKERKDGESIPHGSEKTKLARQGAVVKSRKVKSSKIVPETFSTSGGHTYTVLGLEDTGKADIPKTFLAEYQQKESLPRYLKHVVIEDTLFVELKKRIRLHFFEHLEKWFAESLSKSHVVVAAKKEELNSGHELHLHGLQQRQENIETNIYNVRAVELLLHKECLECHSAGVAKALEKERAEFQKFCEQQDNISKKLQSHICDMESVFFNAPMTEKLVSFNNNLHSELQNHLEMIQVSLRSYRNYLEEALGKFRVSNVDFLKGCRLFSEGGNFSPEEVKLFSKRLQEESKSIGAFEHSVKSHMEKMESRCLDQATELINQAETKFHHLFMNRVFMEKSQRLLKNLQVQIRSEVAKSNLQAVTLNSCLKKLHEKIDACAHPTADKEALTAEELYDFAKVVSKELKKRSQYLDCLLVKEVSPHDNEDFTPLETDERLQSPVAVATRTEQLREESKGLVMGLDPGKFPLINPSRTGKSALDDLSISFIKNLLHIKPPKNFSCLSQRSYHPRPLGPALPTPKRSSRSKASSEDAQKSSAAAKVTKKSSLHKERPKRRIKKLSIPVLSDKRFQIFEEEPPESDTFKGIIMNILWTGSNSLLSLAEEFYQGAEPQIMMPEDLPETLEDCAQLLKQTLLLYQSQTDEYYNACLTEFQDQVKLFEKEFPSVSQLAFERLLKEHKEKLSSSITQIHNHFNEQLEGWESVKAAHKNQLHPSLGHPDNLLQLDALCQEEVKRQKDQADGVHLYTQMLQDCAAECAQNFVSALAAFTENLLLELDESVTVDDIQAAKTDRPREKTPSLIHQKEAELPLEACEVKELTERGSRTWPGIPMTTPPDNSDYIICKETASVTTAKTTLGHVAAVEARDAVYKRYKCDLEQQLAQMQEDSRAQLLSVQRWGGWWRRSVQKIKQHYT